MTGGIRALKALQRSLGLFECFLMKTCNWWSMEPTWANDRYQWDDISRFLLCLMIQKCFQLLGCQVESSAKIMWYIQRGKGHIRSIHKATISSKFLKLLTSCCSSHYECLNHHNRVIVAVCYIWKLHLMQNVAFMLSLSKDCSCKVGELG